MAIILIGRLFFICVVMPLRKGRFGRLWREAYHYLVFHLVEKTPR
jgi:hypothetical protein